MATATVTPSSSPSQPTRRALLAGAAAAPALALPAVAFEPAQTDPHPAWQAEWQALEVAGLQTPEERLAAVAAEAGAAQTELAAGVRDLRAETLATLKDLAERVGRLEGAKAEAAT